MSNVGPYPKIRAKFVRKCTVLKLLEQVWEFLPCKGQQPLPACKFSRDQVWWHPRAHLYFPSTINAGVRWVWQDFSFLIPHRCFKDGRMSCHSNSNVSQPGLSTLLPQQFAVLISRMFVITARGSVKTESKPGELGSFSSWRVLLNTLGLISSCFSLGEKYLIQWI